MKKGYLLAMTPRAGSTNHRYLASTNCPLSDSDPSNRLGEQVEAAIEDAKHHAGRAIGRDFLAVCKFGVLQADGERLGNEVLLLGDVRPRGMVDEGEELLLNLESRLPDLKQLIEGIPWDRTPGLLVNHTELDKWLSNLPEPRKHQRWILYCVATVVSLVAILGIRHWWKSTPRHSSLTTTVQKTSSPDDDDGEKLFSRWFERISACSEVKLDRDQALRELAAIVSAGGWRGNRAKILEDDVIKRFLREAGKPDGNHHVYEFVEANLRDSGGMKTDWMGDSPEPGLVVTARNHLSKAGTELRKFVKEVSSIDNIPNPLLNGAKQFALKRRAFYLKAEGTCVLPLFDTYDWEIYEALVELSGRLKIKKDARSIPYQIERMKETRTNLELEYGGFRKSKLSDEQKAPVRRLKDALLELTYSLEEIDFDMPIQKPLAR